MLLFRKMTLVRWVLMLYLLVSLTMLQVIFHVSIVLVITLLNLTQTIQHCLQQRLKHKLMSGLNKLLRNPLRRVRMLTILLVQIESLVSLMLLWKIVMALVVYIQEVVRLRISKLKQEMVYLIDQIGYLLEMQQNAIYKIYLTILLLTRMSLHFDT